MEEERLQNISNQLQANTQNTTENHKAVDMKISSPSKINQNQYEVLVNGVANSHKENEEDISLNQKQEEQLGSEQYWQSKKNDYIAEMSKLLIQGIEQSDSLLYSMDPEILNQKISEAKEIIQDSSKCDQNEDIEKKLIKETCIWLIEGKNATEYDLIKLSAIIKEYAEKILSSIPSILEKNVDYYRDIIAETAEKKNYNLKLTKDIQNLLLKHQNSMLLNLATDSPGQLVQSKIGLHEIWEIKEISSLSNNTKIEEIDLIRRKRRQHSALLRGLEKLIKAIEKGKGEDEAFSSYLKLVKNPPKMKVQTKMNNTGNVQKPGLDKNSEDNLKKVKLDNNPATPTKEENLNLTDQNTQETKQTKKSQKKPTNKKVKSEEIKNEMDVEIQQQPIQQEQDQINNNIKDTSIQNSINPEQIKQINSKKNQNESKKTLSNQTIQNNSKDNNQKNLFSFFKKNNLKTQQNQDSSTQITSQQVNTENTENINGVIQVEPNLKQNEQNQEEDKSKLIKSIFRRIGGADPRPQHLLTSESIRHVTENEQCKQQWKLIQKKGSNQVIQDSEIIGKAKGKSIEKNARNSNRRRILVLIHDYVRQFKNSFFDQKSKIINPRNFLTRDDDLIQYDMDSEDELQELNAENIENEDDEIDEEDAEDDDSAKQFIVPDGYLSDEGFDSDKEDIFDQKKLNFQNYSFSENTNKQGFIFQEKDKAGDVQNFLMNYRAKKYEEQETFPLCLKKKQNKNLDEQEQVSAPVVWTNERQKQFIHMIHGQYQPKKVLLELIQKIDTMKDISRNRLEKKFKEIVQKDDKQEGEAIKRWLVHSAVINTIEFQENEMEELKKQRQEEYKSSKQSKKDEKVQPQIQSQNQSTISNQSQLNNSIQQQAGGQQQIKQFMGMSVQPVQTQQKKNENIPSPITTTNMQIEEEENKVQQQGESKQNKKQQQEQIKTLKEQKEVQNKNQQQMKQKQDENKDSQINISEMVEEISFNEMSQSFDQKSRKNSFSMNENSNTSVKKQQMKQATLNFFVRKS